MARIPRNTCKLGSKKCEGCNKRRVCYVPRTEEESRAIGTEKLCGECLIDRRREFLTSEVGKVLSQHQAKRHAFEGAAVVSGANSVEVVPPKKPGGRGLSCFVWVEGYNFRKCFSQGCLDVSGSVMADLKAIPGVTYAYYNLD